MHQYLINNVTISRFIPDVCDAITDVFMDEYIPSSVTAEKWLEIAKAFEEKLQLFNCFGAMDKNHVALFHSIHSGCSTYYNYKCLAALFYYY